MYYVYYLEIVEVSFTKNEVAHSSLNFYQSRFFEHSFKFEKN